jgi:lipopolysaccharide biosynthesis glycosyltransferase
MERYALCIITNDAYSDGVCVDILSFLKHNKWFDGDIVVIDYGFLSDNVKRKIMAMYDKVKFKVANDERYQQLHKNVEALKEALPISIYAFPYIYKIEAFGLEGYDRVVFFDSDLVVFGDVKYLFDNPYDFAVSMDSNDKDDVFDMSERWRNPGDFINSGVISIKNPSKEMFDELFDITLSFRRGSIYQGLTYEQDCISTFLDRKKVRIIPFTYNFPQIEFIYRGITLTTQKIVHYYGPYKPWIREDPRADYINHFYNEYLEEVHKKAPFAMEGISVPLVFHFYCRNKEDVFSQSNELHRKILSLYSPYFSSAIFRISVDDLNDNETVKAAVDWVLSCGIKSNLCIKVVKNDKYREARTFFEEIVDRLGDYESPVLFSHNKGGSHTSEPHYENVCKWTAFLYYSIFRNFGYVLHETKCHGILSGYIPIRGAKKPWDYSLLNKYAWHIPGTIWLVNPKLLLTYFKNNNIEIPSLSDYLSAEMFFGNIYDIADRPVDRNYYCVLFEGMVSKYFIAEYFNPYECPHSELIRYYLDEKTAQEYDNFFEQLKKDVGI